jgi:hypothetical protein
MAYTGALSANQQGIAAIQGIDMMGIFTVTPDSSSLVTGEPIDLTAYFATIDAVIPCGVSAIGGAGYVPVPIFDPGAAHTSSNLLIAMMNQDGDAGALEPANGADLHTFTYQIMVFGKAKAGH